MAKKCDNFVWRKYSFTRRNKRNSICCLFFAPQRVLLRARLWHYFHHASKFLFKWLFVLWLFFLAATRLIYVRVNSMWCVVKWNKSCENEIIANYICTSKYEYSKFKWSVRWCRQDSSRLCGSRLIITSSLESSNDPLASSTQYSSFTMF